MARLNDTSALAGKDVNCCDLDVSTRKIDNGYITRVSSYNPKTGDYRSSEKFSRSPDGDADSYGAAGCESLADTKKYLGNDV